MFGNGGSSSGSGSGSGKSAPVGSGSSSLGTTGNGNGNGTGKDVVGSSPGGGAGGGGGGGRNSATTLRTSGASTNLEPWSLKQLESLFDYNHHSATGGGGVGGDKEKEGEGVDCGAGADGSPDDHDDHNSSSRNKKTKKSRTMIIEDGVPAAAAAAATDSKQHSNIDHAASHHPETEEDQYVASIRSSISEMTMYDHHRANFDKYGVSTTIPDETPEEIEMWMSEMDMYLEKLARGGSIGTTGLFFDSGRSGGRSGGNGGNGNGRSKSIKTALGTAMAIDMEYVKSLRMSFLRAEDWNTKRASKCMARYFDQKWKYFGPPPNNNNSSNDVNNNSNNSTKSGFASLIHNFTPRPNGGSSRNNDEGVDDDHEYYSILTRPVTISDLTEEEIDVWKRTGVIQWLSERDRAGRPVQILFGKEQFALPETTVIRIGFVLVEMIIRENVEIQKVGFVQIYYAISQTEFDNPRASRILQSVSSQPLRCVGRHYVYDTQRMFGLMIEAHRVMDPFRRLRLVPHRVSTHQECCYNLMTYGISAESLPIVVTTTAASTTTTTTSGEQHNDHEKQKKKKSEKFRIDTEFNESMIDALLREETIKQQQQQQQRQNLPQNQVVVQPPTTTWGDDNTRDSNASANSTDSDDLQGIVDMLLDEVVPMGDYDNGGAAAPAAAATTPAQDDPRDSTMSVNLRGSFWKAIGLGGEEDNDKIAESSTATDPSSLAAAATAAAAGFDEVAQEESFLVQQQQQQQQHHRGVNMSGIRTTGGGSMGLEMPAPPPAQRPVVQPHSVGQTGKISPVVSGVTGGKSSSSGMIIIVPGPEDVIMGRGRHNKNKPGNRKLQNLLLEYSSRYEAADKYKKTTIAETVLQRMLDTGSRFLVREQVDDGRGDNDDHVSGEDGNATTKLKKKKQTKKGIWVDVTPEKARDKIAHDFRNLRSAAAAAAAATSSSTIPGVGTTSQTSTSSSNTEKRRRSSFANDDDDDDDDDGQVIGSSSGGGGGGGGNNMFSSWFR